METKLTQEQLAALAPYEYNFAAAMSDYLRPAGREGNAIFHEVYKAVTGEDYTKTDSCGSCELNIQRILAHWYNDSKAPEAVEAKPVVKSTKSKAIKK